MSGSLDYVYGKVFNAAIAIRTQSNRPLHLAFAKHLDDVAVAL